MAEFSASEFRKKIQERADKLAGKKKLTSLIAKKVEKTMYNEIKKSIYDSYNPAMYEERGKYGGLLDVNNIVATVSGNHIIIENRAEPNESLWGDTIEGNPEGLLYEWSDEGRIGRNPNMPWSFNYGRWRFERMGMTVRIVENPELKDYIANLIIDNL